MLSSICLENSCFCLAFPSRRGKWRQERSSCLERWRKLSEFTQIFRKRKLLLNSRRGGWGTTVDEAPSSGRRVVTGNIKMKENRPGQDWDLFPPEILSTSRECVRKASDTNRSVPAVKGSMAGHALCPNSSGAFLQLTNPTATLDVLFPFS